MAVFRWRRLAPRHPAPPTLLYQIEKRESKLDDFVAADTQRWAMAVKFSGAQISGAQILRRANPPARKSSGAHVD